MFVLLTYGGWNEAAFLSAELRDGRRRMVRMLVISIGIIAMLYLLANLAFLRALGLAGMAVSDAVAADVMRGAFGAPGAALIALAVGIAALTSANATVMTGARSAYALGRDVPALGFLGRWDDARGTPFFPLLPILFSATNAYLLWSSLAYTGWGALVGVAVLMAGALPCGARCGHRPDSRDRPSSSRTRMHRR